MRLSEIIRNGVRLNPKGDVMGYRVGTAIASRDELIECFGRPHIDDMNYASDGKVTTVWCFETPRGSVEIRDYWWNREGEWSLAAGGPKPVRWLMAQLRRQKIKCYFGTGRD